MQKGRICTRESNDVGKRVDFAHPVAAANTWRTQRPRASSGFKAAAQHSKEIRPSVTRASSDDGPEMAGKEGHAAMESPKAPIAPLEKGYPLKKSAWMIRGFKKSSSDDRPGPGICGSKYVEDAKAARSVRGWDRVPMKKQDQGGKSSLGQPCCPIAAPISRVEA